MQSNRHCAVRGWGPVLHVACEFAKDQFRPSSAIAARTRGMCRFAGIRRAGDHVSRQDSTCTLFKTYLNLPLTPYRSHPCTHFTQAWRRLCKVKGASILPAPTLSCSARASIPNGCVLPSW